MNGGMPTKNDFTKMDSARHLCLSKKVGVLSRDNKRLNKNNDPDPHHLMWKCAKERITALKENQGGTHWLYERERLTQSIMPTEVTTHEA